MRLHWDLTVICWHIVNRCLEVLRMIFTLSLNLARLPTTATVVIPSMRVLYNTASSSWSSSFILFFCSIKALTTVFLSCLTVDIVTNLSLLHQRYNNKYSLWSSALLAYIDSFLHHCHVTLKNLFLLVSLYPSTLSPTGKLEVKEIMACLLARPFSYVNMNRLHN